MRISHLLPSIRFIEAAVRLKSFELAAAELHVTPSAVSQQIAKAEERLGLRLFQRSARHVHPTPEAVELAAALGEAFNIMQEAFGRLRIESARGPVKLTIYQTWATRWLIPRLPSLNAVWPDVSVEFETGMHEVDMLRSDMDFAIRFDPTPTPRVRATKLFDPLYIPVCTPAVAARLKSVADLAGIPLIASQNRPDDWRLWLSVCGAELGDLAPRLKFSNSTLAYEAAIAGAGVVMAQSHLLNYEIERGLLVAPFPVAVAGAAPIYLIEAAGRNLRPAAQAFRTWIVTEAARLNAPAPWVGEVRTPPVPDMAPDIRQ